MYILLFNVAACTFLMQGMFFLVLAGLLLFMFIMSDTRIYFDVPFLMVMLFSVSYFIINTIHFGMTINHLFGPPLAYLIGMLLVQSRNPEKSLLKMISAFAYGTFFFAIFCIIISIPVLLSGTRAVMNIWTFQPIGATNVAVLLTCTISLFAANLVRSGKSKLLIVSGVLSMMAIVLIGARAQLIILFIIFFVSILIKPYPKFGLIIIIAYTCLVALVLYECNLFGIKEFLANTILFRRVEQLEISENIRFKLIFEHIRAMPQNLWGGRPVVYGTWSSHNVWLDIYWYAGFIPFTFYVVFTIVSLIRLLTLLKCKCNVKTKVSVIGVSIGLLLVFFVEPVARSNFYIFWFYFMLSGAVNQYLRYDNFANPFLRQTQLI